MSTYTPGEKDAQLRMIELLRQAEALAASAGLTFFSWKVQTVTGYEQGSELRPQLLKSRGVPSGVPCHKETRS